MKDQEGFDKFRKDIEVKTKRKLQAIADLVVEDIPLKDMDGKTLHELVADSLSTNMALTHAVCATLKAMIESALIDKAEGNSLLLLAQQVEAGIPRAMLAKLGRKGKPDLRVVH